MVDADVVYARERETVRRLAAAFYFLGTLSGLFHKYGHVRCAQFGLRQGARARVYPLRYSTDRATPPQAKFGATLRAAVLFRPDFVARALQTAAGMLVARASSGRKTPGRERNRIYETDHLGCADVQSAAIVNSRSILPWSVLANIALALASTALWSQRNSGRDAQTIALSRHIDHPVPSPSNPAVVASAPLPGAPRSFHWSQVESRDFGEYIANLRALGCPERLVRDMLLAELDEMYPSARRNTIQRELLPPWAGADRRQAVYDAHQRQLRLLAQERRAVTGQLLGFPWSAEAQKLLKYLLCYGWSGAAQGMLNGLPGAAVFLGHRTAEQSLQVLALAEIYRDRASELTERAQGILLPEDRAELAALAGELNSKISTVLTAAESEELNLRIHWLGLADQRHLDLANLTGSELRQIVRLHALATDSITEVLFGAEERSDTERAQRERDFEAAVLKLLGPEKAADLNRADDERYHQVLSFAQERQLPRQTAVAAYELRIAAEDEAKRLVTDSAFDPSSVQIELETIQTATVTALTHLLGSERTQEYLAERGQWIEAITSIPIQDQEVHP